MPMSEGLTEKGGEGGHSRKLVGHGHHRDLVLPPIVHQSLDHCLTTPWLQGHVPRHHSVAIDDRDCVATNRGSPHRLSPAHLHRGHSKSKIISYHGHIGPGVATISHYSL